MAAKLKKYKKEAIFLHKIIIPFFCAGLFFICLRIASASADHLLISQIQIAADKASHDFIEIFNPTGGPISLKNYRLVKRTQNGIEDYSIKSWRLEADTFIPAGGYFLWASGADDSYPASMYADVYTSVTIAANNGIALKSNDTDEIIDSVAWGDVRNAFIEGGAFPSNPEPHQSLERKNKDVFSNATDTNNNANDFILTSSHPRNSKSAQVKTEASVSDIIPVPMPTIIPEVAPAAVVSITPFPVTPEAISVSEAPNPRVSSDSAAVPVYSQGIRINEFLPDPAGEDNEGEWIEIFNDSDKDVDLADWKIDDETDKGSNPFKISNIVINAYGYAVFPYKQTKITLNNNGGEINLILPDNKVRQKISYPKAQVNESYNFSVAEWYWSKKLTPLSANAEKASEGKSADKSNSGNKSNNAFVLEQKESQEMIKKEREEENKNNLAENTYNNTAEETEQEEVINVSSKKSLSDDKNKISLASKKDNNNNNNNVSDVVRNENGEMKSADENGQTAPLGKGAGSIIASDAAKTLVENETGQSFIPYLFLVSGLGIIFALASLRLKEFFAPKKKNPLPLDK